jgi:hypothetical protein
MLMGKRARVQATAPVDAVSTRVDPQEALRAMRAARARYEHFERQFRNHPRLALTYESLFDGPNLDRATAARICEFFGVPLHPMKSKLVKLNPESLREMVTNYDELAEALSRTEFAGMLE